MIAICIAVFVGGWKAIDALGNVEFVSNHGPDVAASVTASARWVWDFTGTPLIVMVIGFALLFRSPAPAPRIGRVVDPIEHRGVLFTGTWELTAQGQRYIQAVGPLCPHDRTPLDMRSKQMRPDSIKYGTKVNESGCYLSCVECQREYSLGGAVIAVRELNWEATQRLRGRENRRQAGVRIPAR